MQNLVGVHIKNESEEVLEDGTVLYPFMLIFPNKRRVYYLKSTVSLHDLSLMITPPIG